MIQYNILYKYSSFSLVESAPHDMSCFTRNGGRVIVHQWRVIVRRLSHGVQYPDIFLHTSNLISLASVYIWNALTNVLCTKMINSLLGCYKTNINCFYLWLWLKLWLPRWYPSGSVLFSNIERSGITSGVVVLTITRSSQYLYNSIPMS